MTLLQAARHCWHCTCRKNGMPPDKLQIVVLVENSVDTAGLLAKHGLSLLLEWGSHRVLFTPGCREVVPGLFVTRAVPRVTSYEDVGGRFFVDPELQHPDGLADDQAIFVPTAQGRWWCWAAPMRG